VLLDLFNAYRVDAQHIASVILALAIWRWGGAPERWLIGVFVGLLVVPLYITKLYGISDFSFGPYGWIWVGIDFVVAAAFVLIAVNANRNYPLWVAGFQLVAVSAHAVKVMVESVSPLAYLILAVGPSYCQLLVIFAGFVRHLLRVRRFGQYRAWRAPLPGVG
jgi:hypothetical protein